VNGHVKRYYGRFSTARQDHWVFGDRASGAYLPKFAWTKIVRHCMVPGTASPDDPALAAYWADRRRRHKPPLDSGTLRQIQAQKGRCPVCAGYLLHADREPGSPREWQQWLTATRKATTRHNLVAHGPEDAPDGIRLVHVSCYRRVTGARKDPAILHS
jgi:RNA-directed DNA polymerase